MYVLSSGAMSSAAVSQIPMSEDETHAAHVMILTKTDNKLFGQVDMKGFVMVMVIHSLSIPHACFLFLHQYGLLHVILILL